MKCTICGSENEAVFIDKLYVLGSEGTVLCKDHRLMVQRFIWSEMQVIATAKRDACLLKKLQETQP